MCRGDDRASRRHRTQGGEHVCQEPSINGRNEPAVHDRDPEADLEDLRARIAATRWPERETVEDPSQGVQLATIQALARYWHDEYDWRRCEKRLNDFPQFITEIDGLDIHFVHVRSKHEDALPVIVTHGWPGSFVEQMKIVDLLTDPTAHGASASDAFHVVIPNMPGYGFSGKPTTTGWGPIRIGEAWVELMKRLGYAQFVAAGGDWGGVVVEVMAGGRDAPASPEPAPPELLGIHTNFAGVVPPEIDKAIQTGGAAAVRSLRRRTTRDRAAGLPLSARGLRAHDGYPPADAVRTGRLTRRPGGVDARPRRGEL